MNAGGPRRPRMPDDVATAILESIRGGLTVAQAAKLHGYTARTVERRARAAPAYARALEDAKAGRPPRPPKPIVHGLAGHRRGCRCEVCNAANTATMRDWRARKRAG